MQKLADGYYRFKEHGSPSEGVSVDMIIDLIDGECHDTQVKLEGSFCVAGEYRQRFIQKLGELIDIYRI